MRAMYFIPYEKCESGNAESHRNAIFRMRALAARLRSDSPLVRMQDETLFSYQTAQPF